MYKTILDLLFYRHCSCCNSNLLSHESGHLCQNCLKSIKIVGSEVCRCCGHPFPGVDIHLCENCRRNKLPFRKARSLYYHEGCPRQLLLRLKYGRDRTVLPGLTQIGRSIIPLSLSDYDDIVPVPLAPNSLRSRGWNQAILLAKIFAGNKKVSPMGLSRVRTTPHQAGLNGAQRRQNLRGAFAVRRPGTFNRRKICLIDDVFTTGTTAAECSRTLLEDGASMVDVLTLTRSCVFR